MECEPGEFPSTKDWLGEDPSSSPTQHPLQHRIRLGQVCEEFHLFPTIPKSCTHPMGLKTFELETPYVSMSHLSATFEQQL
jgi:hypothetical protein